MSFVRTDRSTDWPLFTGKKRSSVSVEKIGSETYRRTERRLTGKYAYDQITKHALLHR